MLFQRAYRAERIAFMLEQSRRTQTSLYRRNARYWRELTKRHAGGFYIHAQQRVRLHPEAPLSAAGPSADQRFRKRS